MELSVNNRRYILNIYIYVCVFTEIKGSLLFANEKFSYLYYARTVDYYTSNFAQLAHFGIVSFKQTLLK